MPDSRRPAPAPPRDRDRAEGSEKLGARAAAALGERLRRDRVFVLADGGRVLQIGASDKAVDARAELLEDLASDGVVTRVEGAVCVNGERPEWVESLQLNLMNGDEVTWERPALPGREARRRRDEDEDDDAPSGATWLSDPRR